MANGEEERANGEPTAADGRGPLADAEPVTGRPLDDPALGDRSNPRWGGSGRPAGAQSLANPDGTSNVMPPDRVELQMPTPERRGPGTAQDQAAGSFEPEVGTDNIRAGRGGGAANPALAEGGEGG
jgi:hypothetical protein